MNTVLEKVLTETHVPAATWMKPYFFYNFFLGGGLAYFYVSALSGFLYFANPFWIPVLFMSSSLVSILIGRAYAYLEYFQSVEQLSKAILLTLFSFALLMHLVTGNHQSEWLFFLILAFHSPMHMLGNLLSWRIDHKIPKTEKESSRGQLSLSEILGRLSAFLSIPLLLLVLQPSQLLLLSAFSFGASFYFNLQLQKQLKFVEEEENLINYRPSLSWKEEGKQLFSYYSNRGVLLVLPQVLFVLTGIYLSAFLLFETSEAFFIEQDDFANFFGLMFSLAGMITIGLKLLLPTDKISSIGIANSLTVVTLMLAIGFGALFLIVGAKTLCNYDLLFASLVYVAFYSLYFTFVRPSLQALILAVMQNTKFNIYTLQKCLTEPVLILFISGFILVITLLFNNLEPSSWLYLTEAFFLAWLILTVYFRKINVGLLKNSVQVRNSSLPSIMLKDNDIQDLLVEKLHSPYPEEVIYAIELLYRNNPKALTEKAYILLNHQLPEVQIHILQKEGLFGAAQLPILEHLLESNAEEKVQKEVIFRICQVMQAIPKSVKNAWDKDSVEIKEAAMVSIWRYGEEEEKIKVKQFLERFSESHEPQYQKLAANVIGRIADPEFCEMLQTLLRTKSTEVIPQALYAAAQLKHPALIPKLIALIKEGPFYTEAVTALANFNQAVLPYIKEVVGNANQQPDPLLLRLCRVCGEINSADSHEILWWMLAYPWTELQKEAFTALKKSGYNAVEKKEIQKVSGKLNELLHSISWLGNALSLLDGKEAFKLLYEALQSELIVQKEKCVMLLQYLYKTKEEQLLLILQGTNSLDAKTKNKALELLSQKLPPSTASKICEVLNKQYRYNHLSVSDRFYEHGLLDEETVALTILQDKNRERRFSRWTQTTALFSISGRFYPTLIKVFLPYLNSEEKLFSQAALHTLQVFCQNHSFTIEELLEDILTTEKIETLMAHINKNQGNELLEIEKIIILKTTGLFAETPENILSDIAKIVKEERVSEGQLIFRKGDEGNCMYIIYEGMVKIHIDNYRLNTLTNRDFFGELGLLDTNPRSAAATTEKDTLLLRLDQESFYDLMANRPEVAKGIMRVLCKRIRTQDNIITDLRKNGGEHA